MRLLVVALLSMMMLADFPALASEPHTLTVAGEARTYRIHLPPAYKPGGPALPMVLALHGGGGSGEQMERDYGLDTYADRAGMIMVYPDGIPAPLASKLHTWNAGGCCGKAARDNSDDVGFLSTVIDVVIRDYGADARHVFVTGHSNGSMMSYRLACEIPSKIAAIAPVSGQRFDCPHLTPVPVLHIHGTLDHCTNYNGGESCGGCLSSAFHLPTLGGDRFPCEAVEPSLSSLAAGYGCGAETEVISRNGPVVCSRWKNCPLHGTVTFCRIEGGGHVWQGAKPLPFCLSRPEGSMCKNWVENAGPILSGVDTNKLIFDFFTSRLSH